MGRLLLIAVLGLSLFGCGGGDSGSKVVEAVDDPAAYEREVRAVRELERKN